MVRQKCSGIRRSYLGCITLQHRTDFIAIRQALMSTPQIRLPNGLMSYGTIEVILNGRETCPDGI